MPLSRLLAVFWSTVFVVATACADSTSPEPEPEPGQIAEDPEDRTDTFHPWFMFPEEPEQQLPSNYSEPSLTNPELSSRIESLQAADLSTFAAMNYQAYPADRTPCAPDASCVPVARIRLNEFNIPEGRADLVGATLGVFLNVDPATGGTIRDYVVLDRPNAAGTLELINVAPNSFLDQQTGAAEGPYPEDMPPINYPDFGCDDGDLGQMYLAWARAHYYVWRGYQLMEFLGSAGNCRDTYWADGYRANLGADNWS
ncbi:MAG: hypothetical protein AAFV29_10590, partial [Myxococcota bacterium]